MRTWARLLLLTLGGLLGLRSTAHAQTPSGNSDKGTVIWTIAGAGGGFGIGLWAGLTKFDDAINSDRKVWTSAVVGAAVGAVGGYLIGRSRADRSRSNSSSTKRTVPRPLSIPIRSFDRSDRFLEQTAAVSVRFSFEQDGLKDLLAFAGPANGPFAPAIPLSSDRPSR